MEHNKTLSVDKENMGQREGHWDLKDGAERGEPAEKEILKICKRAYVDVVRS